MFNCDATSVKFISKGVWDFSISGKHWHIATDTLNRLEDFWVEMRYWDSAMIMKEVLTTKGKGKYEYMLCVDELKRRAIVDKEREQLGG